MSTGDKIKMAFFEIEDWQRAFLSTALENQDLFFYHQPLDERTVGKAKDAEVVSIFIRSDVDREVIERLPKLRLLATRSTGYDHIDLAAATEKGVTVSNVPFYGENTVAEHTFGLILDLSRKIHRAYLKTNAGDFSLDGLEGFDLKGKTIGVIGTGAIGLRVIRIAKGFGMEVLASDMRENPLLAEVLGFTYVGLAELLGNADIITLHAPLTPQTYHLINWDSVRLIKRGALLINTSRGGLVDTAALQWALDEGILGGAGLDVIEGEELIQEEQQLLTEPAAEDKLRMVLRQYILLRREDVIITPHIAFYSRDALLRILDTTVANINGFLQGQPLHVVNPEVLLRVVPPPQEQRSA